jgi:uncharacterized protein (TIGR03032 family)
VQTPDASTIPDEKRPVRREVRFEYSRDFPSILEHLNVALLVSTYQAGKLAVVGVHRGQLNFAFHNFDRVMGVAVGPQRIAVGARRQVYLLHPARDVAAGIEPRGTYDACWLTLASLVSGNVHGHELAWGADGLWLVNTLFSCLCTLDESYSFVPRWRPPFITELAGQDRCHLNGMALQDGRPRFVTAHSESNEPAGWRPQKATSGCVIDVPSGETVVRGLCMPHSPRWYEGRLWALDSGNGRLVQIDPASGHVESVERFPGYTRGMAFCGQFAFVGLSRVRETAIFGGIPIAERRDELRCGVAVVDLLSGRAVAWLQFHTGVEEVFAVCVLPGCRNPVFSGPSAEDDDRPDVWLVPPEGKASPKVATGSASVSPPTLAPSLQPAAHLRAQQLAVEASLLRRQGRWIETLQRLKLAAEAAPGRADLLNDLGNLYQELGDQDAAMASYRRAVQVQPGFVAAHQNLGYLSYNYGEPEEALRHYEQAQHLAPAPMNRLLAATVLPVVYDSTADIGRWREHFTAGVRQLADEGVRIDTTRSLLPTPFFLAYQGLNDRDVACLLGRIPQGLDLCEPGAPSRGRRLKVGFLSAYFRDHTIGRLNLGRIRHLARDRFEVTVIYAGLRADEKTRIFAQVADRFLAVTREVEAARRQIAQLDLDVLVFADVGMDALTYTLAFSRMAPVQCVTWGHPDTTGSPAIDYFLSSQLLETAEADSHYAERLVRLPNLGTYYERPELSGPTRGREFFGLPADRNLYVCPQTLFKLHPEFDPILAGILRQDRQGQIVLLEGRVANWTTRLKRRLARTLGDDASRVRFLAAQPNQDFLRLLALADVALDPFPFGGGNTSYEALAVGTPIVTWPSPYLRGRITAALYRKMGWTDCIVGSAQAYVDLAVRLAADRAYGESIRQKTRSSCPVLFEDMSEVKSFEEFLEKLVQ